MASTGSLSRYDAILAHRSRQQAFAQLNEQRSESRKAAAEKVLSQGESTRNAVLNSTSQASTGLTQLTEMMIRSRMSIEAKAKAEPSKWYA